MLDVREIQGFGGLPNPQDANQKPEISQPVGDECFLAGIGGGGPLEPKTDQQIAADTDQFPKDKKLQKIVRENYAQHRESEQAEAREKSREPRVVAHVTPG